MPLRKTNKLHFLYVGKDQELFVDLYPFFFSSCKLIISEDQPFSFFSTTNYSRVIVSRWYYQKYSEYFKNFLPQDDLELYLYDSCDSADDLSNQIPNCFKIILRKQMYEDKSLYQNYMIGGKYFSDWYYRNFQIVNEFNKDRVAHKNFQIIDRSLLFFNNLIGFHTNFILPFNSSINKIIRFLIKFLYKLKAVWLIRLIFKLHRNYVVNSLSNNKSIKGISTVLFARFSGDGFDKSVKFHRNHILNYLSTLPDSEEINIGTTSLSTYNKELDSGFNIFLSPYGTGEICYRDLEIVFNNNFIIKPTMSHIDTFPNIYENSIEYKLDFSDIDQKLKNLPLDKRLYILNYQRKILRDAYKEIELRINDIL
jgi:hypothetical protein